MSWTLARSALLVVLVAVAAHSIPQAAFGACTGFCASNRPGTCFTCINGNRVFGTECQQVAPCQCVIFSCHSSQVTLFGPEGATLPQAELDLIAAEFEAKAAGCKTPEAATTTTAESWDGGPQSSYRQDRQAVSDPRPPLPQTERKAEEALNLGR